LKGVAEGVNESRRNGGREHEKMSRISVSRSRLNERTLGKERNMVRFQGNGYLHVITWISVSISGEETFLYLMDKIIKRVRKVGIKRKS
jgi:hypothetical protein